MDTHTHAPDQKNNTAFSDRRAFIQGTSEMILIHSAPVVKYPTEVMACDHLRNPQAHAATPPRRAESYIPPSVQPDEAWCTGCRMYHHVSKFHRDATRRRGLQYNCIDFRATQRRAERPPQVSEHWYRSRR